MSLEEAGAPARASRTLALLLEFPAITTVCCVRGRRALLMALRHADGHGKPACAFRRRPGVRAGLGLLPYAVATPPCRQQLRQWCTHTVGSTLTSRRSPGVARTQAHAPAVGWAPAHRALLAFHCMMQARLVA